METNLTIEQYEALSELVSKLDELEIDPPLPFWFRDDESISYCHDCIKALKPDAKFPDDYGGGFSCEEDAAERCDHCGNLLQYTLTDYGVSNELEHFSEYGFDWSSPTECYEMARVAHGLLSDDPKNIALLKILQQGSA